ncbi:MAG: DUF89 family protein [Deltaproteobacteria bacterium]|nr:DUF89 family protein [Deltaproteobacteria bacterium]
MRTYLECFPCFLNQALRAGRIATNDDSITKRLLDEIGMMLKEIPMDSSPPETGRLIYKKVSEITGNNDPYKEIKRENTDTALELYPALKKKIESSNDKLLTAIRMAVAGNVIDFGIDRKFNIETDIADILSRDFAIYDYDEFKAGLTKADKVLYLGDNAGEAVFDKILIEQIKKTVTYIVRDKPVINDATYDDAVHAGIDKVASILSSGTDAPGTVLKTCSAEFIELYNNANFIISKGQGNFEALSDEKRPIFFLLKVKCPVVANHLNVHEGDIIFKTANLLNR